MHHLIPRLLKALFVGIVISFLPLGLALGGLLTDVVDTVEEIVVDEEEASEADDPEVSGDEELVQEEEDLVGDGTLVQETSEVTESADGTSAETDEDLLELDGEDKYVTVENELLESTADSIGLASVGTAAYDLQEYTLHGSITKLTGKKVDHYYVWVCIGKVCLPVDPFTASN